MKVIKVLVIRNVIVVVMVGIAGFIMGFMSNNAPQNFNEVYHNDYISSIKLFIEECRQIYGEQAITVARHLINLEGKHLGLMYRCEGLPDGVRLLITNQTMSVLYTKQFYEVK